MVTAQDVKGVMAMMPSFSTEGNEGPTAKLPIEFAGYVKPGPARTPIIKFSETAIERAKKKLRVGKDSATTIPLW